MNDHAIYIASNQIFTDLWPFLGLSRDNSEITQHWQPLEHPVVMNIFLWSPVITNHLFHAVYPTTSTEIVPNAPVPKRLSSKRNYSTTRPLQKKRKVLEVFSRQYLPENTFYSNIVDPWKFAKSILKLNPSKFQKFYEFSQNHTKLISL